MARFHVLDGETVHTGAEAFLVLWSAMPGWRHLASMARILRLTPLLEQGYGWFARRRLRRRCQDGRCAVS